MTARDFSAGNFLSSWLSNVGDALTENGWGEIGTAIGVGAATRWGAALFGVGSAIAPEVAAGGAAVVIGGWLGNGVVAGTERTISEYWGSRHDDSGVMKYLVDGNTSSGSNNMSNVHNSSDGMIVDFDQGGLHWQVGNVNGKCHVGGRLACAERGQIVHWLQRVNQ